MNQATHLLISIISHIKNNKNDNTFGRNINSCRIFQILQKECQIPLCFGSVVFIHSVYEIVFIKDDCQFCKDRIGGARSRGWRVIFMGDTMSYLYLFIYTGRQARFTLCYILMFWLGLLFRVVVVIRIIDSCLWVQYRLRLE